jgi:hypothetical protein
VFRAVIKNAQVTLTRIPLAKKNNIGFKKTRKLSALNDDDAQSAQSNKSDEEEDDDDEDDDDDDDYFLDAK